MVMTRTIQDIKLPAGSKPAMVLWEAPIPDGATQETWVHDRMEDHFEGKDGVEAVRVIDDESGDVLYQWTFMQEAQLRLDRKRREVSETALKEIQRRQDRSTMPKRPEGIERIKRPDGMEDDVLVTDGGITLEITESLYIQRGYTPDLNELPWRA